MSGASEHATESVTGDESPLRYAHTPEMPELLDRLNVSLWVTTYQAGKLVVFRPRGGRLSMLPRSFNQAMGLALSRGRLAVGTRAQIWFLENEPQFASAFSTDHPCDTCYLPRRAHVTGNVQGHEIAWDGAVGADDRPRNLWIVNTLFSCLCTLDDRYSFLPRWQPPFITELSNGDRCHLNGIAMRDGQPQYVTLLAATNEPAGWRQHKLSGGCVMDVTNGEIILGGLCMPHSPRWHDGRLWLLNSGRGELLCVDPVSGESNVVARFPGYPRGLALVSQVGFVGLSQVRETATFGGLPLTEGDQSLQCGVWAVDLRSGAVLGRIEFQGVVAEIFDVQVLRGVRDPFVVGLEKETFEQVFVVPPTVRQRVTPVGADSRLQPAVSSAAPGTVIECRYLGRNSPIAHEKYASDVYYVRYTAANDDGCCQASKLHIPVGTPPADGWPVSVWCHGLGDSATQLHRWPVVPGDWRRTRGMWAGRWANMGIATLTPWMPGDGPSEPLGTYSPYSLDRNGQALAGAFLALGRLAERQGAGADAGPASEPHDQDPATRFHLNLQRMVLRTDCVASSLLVVGRAGRMQGHVTGLPGFDQRFRQMTEPKVQTLRSWGWDVQVLRATADQGTSFGVGGAQQWVFQQFERLL